ncbi:hypothetical protein FGO68_gene14604 [Halteria grandinella]|uniref:HEAT repeat domain-containing protein n=1 Tax=Halteria grandinella TaxID=5974 RepID=A0A8J8NHE0_HALGN|nr:hypothetical protein FGO68_gene14604 [Halteria grandinella]
MDRRAFRTRLCFGHRRLRSIRVCHSARLYCACCTLLFASCSSAPKSFLSMSDPAAINRARAVAFGQQQPDANAIPVLIDRLTDDDPVVRLASHESLKKRTGQDFGYLPYAEGDELAVSVQRWKQWWANAANGRMVAGSPQSAIPQAPPYQVRMNPTPVSEASFREKKGLFRNLFRRR